MSEILYDSHINTTTVIEKGELVTAPLPEIQNDIRGFLNSEDHSLQLDYFTDLFTEYAKEKDISIDEILAGATAVLGLHRTLLECAQSKPSFTTGEVWSILEWTLREQHFIKGVRVNLRPDELLDFCTDKNPDKKIINGDNNRNYSL